jgi:hypothetical protein
MSKSSTRKSRTVTVAAPVIVSDVESPVVAAEVAAVEVAAEPEAAVEIPAAAPEAEAAAPVAAAPAAKTKKYPREGGKCWQVWNACDELSAAGTYPTVKHLRDLAIERNWNVSNASQEFYAWRKFHSVK